MRKRVLLHVGPPKTGTTYLQRVLRSNSEALARSGVAVIGSQPALRRAASELIGRSPFPEMPVPSGAWDTLRGRIAAEQRDVVMSCERFSLLGAPEATRFRDAFAGAEVHVIVTARDEAALLASRWQERIKNGGTETWAEFCEQVARDPDFLRRMTRLRQSVHVWGDVLPADRVHVATVPKPGQPPDLLVERFCESARIPLSALPTRPPKRANRSVGPAGAELLRRVNRNKASLSRSTHRRQIKELLAEELSSRRPGETMPVVPSAAFEAVRADTAAVIEEIEERGHPVAGQLGDLTYVPPPPEGTPASAAPLEGVVDAAVDALVALASQADEAQDPCRSAGPEAARGAGADTALRRRLTRVLKRRGRR